MILSIIIPHYNDNKNLNFLLNEISNIQNTEVIVIDDFSKKIPTVKNNIILITNKKKIMLDTVEILELIFQKENIYYLLTQMIY